MAAKNNKSKHDLILEAAIKVFAKRGFHHSKISEIARQAKVADGTIYLYFKNKDDILINIFEESLDRIINNITPVLERQPDALAKLRTFIRLYLDLINENRNLAEILQVELRQSNKFMKEYVPVRFIDYINIIAGLVREGQDEGLIDNQIVPGIYKRALFGALDEIALHAVLTHKGKDYLDKCADQLNRLFIDGILAEQGSRETRPVLDILSN